MSTLKMKELRPRELKFCAVYHRMSKERTPDSSSGLPMLHLVFFQQCHTELAFIQPLGGVGVVQGGGLRFNY